MIGTAHRTPDLTSYMKKGPFGFFRYYVNDNSGSDSAHDGKSPGEPFKTINKALDVLTAQGAGQILIGDGTYVETVQYDSSAVELCGIGRDLDGGAVRIKAPSPTADCIVVNAENARISNITALGGDGNWTGCGWNLVNSQNGRFIGCRYRKDAGTVLNNLYGGTAVKMQAGEANHIEDFFFTNPRQAFHIRGESSEHVFVNIRGTGAWDKVLWLENVGSSGNGGHQFLHWKSQNGGGTRHQTTTTGAISSGSLPVTSVGDPNTTGFRAATAAIPQYALVGSWPDMVEIKYTGISGNSLTGVTVVHQPAGAITSGQTIRQLPCTVLLGPDPALAPGGTMNLFGCDFDEGPGYTKVLIPSHRNNILGGATAPGTRGEVSGDGNRVVNLKANGEMWLFSGHNNLAEGCYAIDPWHSTGRDNVARNVYGVGSFTGNWKRAVNSNSVTSTSHYGDARSGASKEGYNWLKGQPAGSPPADSEIGPGEAVTWYDYTNGAAKLMVKAKQLDGTVRTGQVALT